MNGRRFALLHLAPEVGEVGYNRLQIRKALAIAAGYSADLAITPELAEAGIHFESLVDVTTIPSFPNCFLLDLKQVAYKYRMHMMIGLPEVKADKLYDTLVHINNEGAMQAIYRKIQVDDEVFSCGEEVICSEVEGLNIGMLISEDSFREDSLRKLKQMSVDLLVVAGRYDLKDSKCKGMWRTISKAYQLPILMCSSLQAKSRGKGHFGTSLCLEDGSCLYEWQPREAQVIIVDYHEGQFKLLGHTTIG